MYYIYYGIYGIQNKNTNTQRFDYCLLHEKTMSQNILICEMQKCRCDENVLNSYNNDNNKSKMELNHHSYPPAVVT